MTVNFKWLKFREAYAVAKQLPSSCDSVPVEKLNETAIAGIAYISIHASKVETRNWAKYCLSTIQSKLK